MIPDTHPNPIDRRESAGRREWTALTVLLLPLLLVSMDVSVLYFAVPFISADLAPSSTQQLWIFDVYGFVLAGLLLTMGSVGDLIGRRRLLLIGAAGFGLASLGAAYASTAGLLILARAVMGIGGATLMPSTLGLVRAMFHDPRQRSTAVALWTAVMSAGVAVGPVISGALLEHFWWGSVFLINLPAMLLLLVAAPLLVPEFTGRRRRFDATSAVLSLGAILPVVYAVKQFAAHGLATAPAVLLLVGLTLGAVFIRRQRRHAHPMLDLELLRGRWTGGALAANLVAMFGLVGSAIFTTQYLQSVLAMSPLRAAIWSMLPSVAVAAAAPAGAALAARVGPRRTLAAGFTTAAAGFVVLGRVHTTSPLAVVLVGAAVLAVGLVVVLTLVTEIIVGGAPPEKAGAAAALSETCGELGGALGMALLGSVGAAVYRSRVLDFVPRGLSEQDRSSVRDTLGGAVAVARHLAGPERLGVVSGAREAFTQGMDVVAWTGAGLLALAAVATLTFLRQPTATPGSSGDYAEGSEGSEAACTAAPDSIRASTSSMPHASNAGRVS